MRLGLGHAPQKAPDLIERVVLLDEEAVNDLKVGNLKPITTFFAGKLCWTTCQQCQLTSFR
jgi:hypothetical protein